MDFLIFGPPSIDVRYFRDLFKDRNSPITVFRIFRQVAMEVWGDAKLSHALLAEYRRKKVDLATSENIKLGSMLSNPSDLVKDCTFAGTDKEFFDPLGKDLVETRHGRQTQDLGCQTQC